MAKVFWHVLSPAHLFIHWSLWETHTTWGGAGWDACDATIAFSTKRSKR